MYGKLMIFKRVVSTCSVPYSKKGSSKKLLEFLADMPRNPGNVLEVQRQRINSAKKSGKYSPGTIYLQVLGSGARGVPNTLYLFTDQKRYLFNCGEGTQRLAHEHKVRLSKLEHIFITSKTWRNIGGLPGVSLTLQDVGVPNITLHGPEGLDELYNATRRFVIMKDMSVQMAKCSPSEDFNDNVMSVKYVLLGPDEKLLESDPQPIVKKAKKDDELVDKEFEEFIHDKTDYYNKPDKQADSNRSKSPKHNKNSSPEKEPVKTRSEKVLEDLQKRTNCTVAYICTFQKIYGTLDLQKCVEKGVKPGPLLGKLKMGEDVVLPDGTLVLSKDVKTPDDPGPVFIVLEVPDISYLKESEFSAHFDNGANPPENVPAIVVHMTPPHVFNDPRYRAFMSQFGPKCSHLALNRQNSCLGSEAAHRTQHKLHLLDADMFPLLRDASLPAVWRAHPPPPPTENPAKLRGLEELKNKIALAQFQNIINMEGSKGDGGSPLEDAAHRLEVIAGRTLTAFHLRPKRGLDRSAEPKLHIEDYIQEAMAEEGFAESLQQFRKVVDNVRYAKNTSQKEYPKVVFLGTGSCIPSKTRNTSGIAIQVDENRSMLLDCGEGTFGQLVRFHGPKRVNAFLRTLKAIYVSHLHADHHLGLIGVLQARREALEEISSPETDDTLYLLAPGQIVSWLATYDMQFERIRNEFTLVPNQNLLVSQEGETPSPGLTPPVLSSIGVQNIRTCYVSHCPNAFGVTIDVDADHRITYSGDTIPCDALVELGKESTLLIHEATMEDELADEARHKMHSTTSQAIEVGRRMRAARTLLTHFSQRYARLPRLNAAMLRRNAAVGIAFDNMQVTMSDLELLPHMYAPLQLMFAEHCVDMEVKAAARAAKRARREPGNRQYSAKYDPARLTDRDLYETDSDNEIDGSKKAGDGANENPTVEEVKEHSSCQVIISEPLATPSGATPTYRDSNASRLRSEIARMVGKAPVKHGSRSKSCSSTKSALSSTPKSHNSVNASPVRLIGIHTPRTVSDPFNLDKGTHDSRKNLPSNGHVINTCSRTLNSASAAHSTDRVPENKNKKNELPKESMSGYGKPLVTPLNKRIVIRGNQSIGPPTSSSNANEKPRPSTATVRRCRSPVKSWKAENRPSSSSSVSSYKQEVSKTRIPTKDTSGHRPRRMSDVPPRADTSGRPATGTGNNQVSRIPYRLSDSPRRSSSVDRKPQGTKSMTSTNNPAYERKVKSWDSNAKSPSRCSPRSQTPIGMRSSNMKDPTLKSSEQNKNIIAKENNRIVTNGSKAKSVNHSNKSFKPQLEDIKSSYLLLNKKNIDRNTNEPVNNETNFNAMKVYQNENTRRVQLLQIKQRYKSKQFWNESKYDKIEGLNWVTWK